MTRTLPGAGPSRYPSPGPHFATTSPPKNPATTSALRDLDTLMDEILAAKSPEELDAKALKLDAIDAARNGSYDRLVSDKISSMSSFIPAWRSFLSAWATQDFSSALEAVKYFVGSNPGREGLPQGKIIARIQVMKSTVDFNQDASLVLVKSLKTLDEIEPALLKWNASHLHLDSQPALIQALIQLNRIYQSVKTGLPTSTELPGTISTSVSYPDDLSDLAPLKAQLIIFAAPRILGLKEGTRANPGESANDFLNRLLDEAQKSGDSERAIKTQKLISDLQFNSLGRPIDRSLPAKYEAVAKHMEDTGFYAFAAFYYLLAIRDAAAGASVDHPKSSLEKIKKAHPEDFKTGEQYFVSNGANLTPGAFLPATQSSYSSMIPGMRTFPPGVTQRLVTPNGVASLSHGPAAVPSPSASSTPDASKKRP